MEGHGSDLNRRVEALINTLVFSVQIEWSMDEVDRVESTLPEITFTDADLHCQDSLVLDEQRMKADGVVCVNGVGARHSCIGDSVTVMFCEEVVGESTTYCRIVIVDEENRPRST